MGSLEYRLGCKVCVPWLGEGEQENILSQEHILCCKAYFLRQEYNDIEHSDFNKPKENIVCYFMDMTWLQSSAMKMN